ncbi:MAG: metallophosphoesterase family protein [Phycisphaeraceae bacterium]
MRIVLFGDLHFYRLWLAPWHLASKRVLGQSNLVINRRKRFRHDLVAPMIDRAVALKPDLLLLSGDLTTTSLKQEFLDAARAIKPLTDRVPTVLVPGNHDRYTFTASRTRRIDRLLSDLIPNAFPHTRDLTDRWRLLALDGAVPRLGDARGRLGSAQFERARAFVDSLDASRGLVVLCHYPCVVPGHIHEHDSHALDERDALRKTLEACRARVVYLHGHIHRPWHHEPGDGSGVPFTCIDAGAPCMIDDAHPQGQGFFEIVLPEDPAAALDVRHHPGAPHGG